MIEIITPAPDPNILTIIAPIVSATTALLIGLIAGWIAFQQWRTAQTKAQLDLYAHRFPIYSACKRVLVSISEDFRIDPYSARDFAVETGQARFLFDEKIEAYVKTLFAIGGEAGRAVVAKKAAGEALASLKDQDRESWLLEEIEKLDKLFAPYLLIEVARSRVGAIPALPKIPPPPIPGDQPGSQAPAQIAQSRKET